MKTVLIVIGTRPEAIKMYPVIRALKKKKQIKTAVAITSQHKELLYDALDSEQKRLFEEAERFESEYSAIKEFEIFKEGIKLGKAIAEV